MRQARDAPRGGMMGQRDPWAQVVTEAAAMRGDDAKPSTTAGAPKPPVHHEPAAVFVNPGPGQ